MKPNATLIPPAEALANMPRAARRAWGKKLGKRIKGKQDIAQATGRVNNPFLEKELRMELKRKLRKDNEAKK